MKRVIVAAMVAACYGCLKVEKSSDADKAWQDHGRYVLTKTVEIEGHKYIIMDVTDGGSIIHSAACPCHSK